MRPYFLKCYVMGKSNVFYAACLTLNLSATGKTIEEAKKNLDFAIKEYFEIIQKDKRYEEYEHLLKRPAPLFMYFEYSICSIVTFIHLTKKWFTFKEKIPLKPALEY